MEFIFDYHLIFVIMSFILLILSVLLLFFNTDFEKAVAANIFIVFNLILIMIISFGFSAIDIYGHNETGVLVHNVVGSMYPFTVVYWVFWYINFMLLFYCVYLYIKKPWDDINEKTK